MSPILDTPLPIERLDSRIADTSATCQAESMPIAYFLLDSSLLRPYTQVMTSTDRNSLIERSYWHLAGENLKLQEQLDTAQAIGAGLLERLNAAKNTIAKGEDYQNQLLEDIEASEREISMLRTARGNLINDLLYTQEKYEELFKQSKDYLDGLTDNTIGPSEFAKRRLALKQTLEGGSSHEPVGTSSSSTQTQPSSSSDHERPSELRVA